MYFIRKLFCIKFAKEINPQTLIVNIDESNINYKTKTNYSWCRKGTNRDFKCLPFSGSINMIMSIFSNGAWFWVFKTGNTNGEVFNAYLECMLSWLKSKNTFGFERIIVLLDNWSSHRWTQVRQTMMKSDCIFHYLPQSSPILAPVKKVF